VRNQAHATLGSPDSGFERITPATVRHREQPIHKWQVPVQVSQVACGVIANDVREATFSRHADRMVERGVICCSANNCSETVKAARRRLLTHSSDDIVPCGVKDVRQ
jgi:hypothetical protein